MNTLCCINKWPIYWHKASEVLPEEHDPSTVYVVYDEVKSELANSYYIGNNKWSCGLEVTYWIPDGE